MKTKNFFIFFIFVVSVVFIGCGKSKNNPVTPGVEADAEIKQKFVVVVDKAKVLEQIALIKNTTTSFPLTSFVRDSGKKRVLDMIERIENFSQKDMFDNALRIVEDHLLPAIDGCVTGNVKSDLLTNCDNQKTIYPLVIDLKSYLKGGKLINATDGGVVSSNDASVNIPPNALSTNEVISVIPLTIKELPARFPTTHNFLGAVDFEPDGLTFLSPVTITIPLNKNLQPNTVVDLFYYDETISNPQWILTGNATVNSDGITASAKVNHFSIYASAQGAPQPLMLKDISSVSNPTTTTNDGGINITDLADNPFWDITWQSGSVSHLDGNSFASTQQVVLDVILYPGSVGGTFTIIGDDGTNPNFTVNVNLPPLPALSTVDRLEYFLYVDTNGNTYLDQGLTQSAPSPTLNNIMISPVTAVVAVSNSKQFNAVCNYTPYNSTENCSSSVSWFSTNTLVGNIDANGLFTANNPGETTIYSTKNAVTSNSSLVLVDVSSISVAPTTATLSFYGTQQFTAVCKFSDNSTLDCTNKVVWSSSNTAIGTISQSGLFTANGLQGTANVSATFDTVASNTASVNVTMSGVSLITLVLGKGVSAPIISADGTKVAFSNQTCINWICTGGIFIVNSDGTGLTQLTNGGSATGITGNGGKIVFANVVSGQANIYVVDTITQQVTQLTNGPGNNTNPIISFDGSKIVFYSDRAIDGNKDIYIMNSDGTGITQLTNTSEDEIPYDISSDGSKITYVKSIPGTNFGAFVLNTLTMQTFPMSINANNIKISEDGTKVAFSNYVDIYVANSDGTNAQNLTNDPNVTGEHLGDINGNGTKITFYSVRTNPASFEIFVVNSSGTGLKQLTSDGFMNTVPSISSDGTKIAYRSDNKNGGGLFLLNSPTGFAKNFKYKKWFTTVGNFVDFCKKSFKEGLS